MLRLFGLLLLVITGFNGQAVASESVARLVLNVSAAKPGDTIYAGVHLKLPSEWHTYWRNAGEAGEPAKIIWQLPDGISAGEIIWPVPEKYVLGGVGSYVYHNEVLLIVPLTISKTTGFGSKNIFAKVQWFECKEVCKPASGSLSTTLVVGEKTLPSPDAPLIEEWLKHCPSIDCPVSAVFRISPPDSEGKFTFTIHCSSPYPVIDFFPYENKLIGFDIDSVLKQTAPDQYEIIKKATLYENRLYPQLSGLLIFSNAPTKACVITARFISPASSTGTGSISSNRALSTWTALLFAFLGGIILNFMPCVLPVISLKVLSFVNQAGQSPSKIRLMGLVFTAGVLISLWVLAWAIIAVQQAGKMAGWGMQFQNPYFIVFITTLITVIALNLFGVFEITAGGSAMDTASTLAGKGGLAGSFFHGALVVFLATPCTAPFLGLALGFAFTQPPLMIIVIFTMIALGLALPYLLVSMFPKLVNILPKPGQWMVWFKVIMGFPMLATAIWLMSIAFNHYGSSAVWLGIFLVFVALALWLYGQFYQRAHKPVAGIIIPIILLLTGYLYALEKELDWRHPPQKKSLTTSTLHSSINWLPWSREAVEQARAQGKVVLVDFSADWCFTCKVNMKTSIDIPSVRAKLKEIDAVTFLGDYTLRDDEITKELRKFNRGGVPLVVIYPRNTNAEPIVLPELLTPGIVLEALEKATK